MGVSTNLVFAELVTNICQQVLYAVKEENSDGSNILK